MTGTWHYYPYRSYHTQSTRLRSFGGGATGGLNDRFDMILFSSGINLGATGISYVAGSTTPVGNDGNHYNDSLNMMPNTAAPLSVINALYNASGHLPVYALFNFTSVTGVQSLGNDNVHLSVFPNPFNENASLKFKLEKPTAVSIKVFDVLGKEVLSLFDGYKPSGECLIPLASSIGLEKGLYIIHLQTDNIILSTDFIKY